MSNFNSDELVDAFGAVVEDQTPFYFRQPIPCELDGKVSRFISLLRDAPAPARLAFLAHDKEDFSWRLLAFADRMASLAVRDRSRERVRDGLLALVIGDYGIDMRDVLGVLALLYDAAGKVGASPEESFAEAATFAGNSVAKAVSEFPGRSPANRSLRVFGHREGSDREGFRYERA